MEIVNNNAMDIETKTATKLEIDTTSNLLITPKKNVNLDVENLDDVSSVDLQTLLNQRLQRSRSTSKAIPVSSASSSRRKKTDGQGSSPNSISSTPERTKLESLTTTGKRFDATWTTPGGQAIQFNFMSKNIPTTPEIVKRNSTHFPAKNYDAVWHNTSPWKARRASPLRNNSRNTLQDNSNNMQNNVNGNDFPYQMGFNNSSNDSSNTNPSNFSQMSNMNFQHLQRQHQQTMNMGGHQNFAQQQFNNWNHS